MQKLELNDKRLELNNKRLIPCVYQCADASDLDRTTEYWDLHLWEIAAFLYCKAPIPDSLIPRSLVLKRERLLVYCMSLHKYINEITLFQISVNTTRQTRSAQHSVFSFLLQ